MSKPKTSAYEIIRWDIVRMKDMSVVSSFTNRMDADHDLYSRIESGDYCFLRAIPRGRPQWVITLTAPIPGEEPE